MPGTYKTKGIVIGRTNYGEADRILTLMTAEHGKIRAIAKGSRKIKSRSGGHIELFGIVDFILANSRSLDIVTSATLTWYPHTIASDYNRLGFGYLFASMVNKLVDEDEPHIEVYELLVASLGALEAHGVEPQLELWFKLRLLDALGYKPGLDGCVVCGESSGEGSYSISPERGGLVDKSCRSMGDLEISINAIKLWRLVLDHTYASIRTLTESNNIAVTTMPNCDSLYEYHLGRAYHPTAI
jgi:DNA repair protein RecO (recombination protein O)